MSKPKRLRKQAKRSGSKLREFEADAARSHGARKQARIAPHQRSVLDSHFAWSAKKLDRKPSANWDWDLTPEELEELLRFLEEMGSLTWREIDAQTSGGHRKHHPQGVETLCKEAQDRLSAIFSADGTDAPEELFRFRLAGKIRLWGMREDRTFFLLWYDRDHKVYPTAKRHT